MKSKSIKRQLLFVTLGLMFAAFFVNTVVSSIIVSRNIQSVLIEKAKETVYEMAKQVEEILNGVEDPIDSLQIFVESKAAQQNVTYAIVISTDVKAVAHSNRDRINREYEDAYTVEGARYGKRQFSRWYADAEGIWTYDIFEPVYRNGELYGVLDIGIPESGITSIVASVVINQIVNALVSFLIIGSLLWFLIDKTLILPFRRVRSFVQAVGEGDFTTDIVKDRNDEIGDIQEALQNMAGSLREKTILAQKIAKGDLTDTGTPTSSKDALGEALKEMVLSLNSIMANMASMAVEVSSGSQQLSQASNSLADGATQQAAAVEEISSSVNEIGEEVDRNAQRAGRASTLAEESTKTAEVGATQMEEMLSAMNEISTASAEISKIMKVIDDIAFQTNLLALNAAVEAARAGQHGKGFAVVADEVRSLAQRSAKASAETAQLISKAADKVLHGKNIAQETSTSFGNIVSRVGDSAELVKEIAQSAASEVHTLKEIAQGLDQISMVSQQNTAGSEETAATSDELSHHADLLQEAISKFRLMS